MASEKSLTPPTYLTTTHLACLSKGGVNGTISAFDRQRYVGHRLLLLSARFVVSSINVLCIMDPLSITTAVVTLTGVCLTTVKRISVLRDRFKLTWATLTAILSETTVVSASLGQVQTALLRANSQFATRFERDSALLETLDTALIGCSVVVLALQEEIDKLEVGLLKAQVNGDDAKTQLNWKLRIKILWKESAMKDLLTQIRGQQTSLGFLLQALAIDSMSDLSSLIANNSSLLEKLSEDTSTLRKAYPSIRTPRSLFDVDRQDGVSLFSHTASSAGATEFDFDNFLIDSPVYRRAFMGGYLRPRLIVDCDSERSAGDTETIRESGVKNEDDSRSWHVGDDAVVQETTETSSSKPEEQINVDHENNAPASTSPVNINTIVSGPKSMKVEDVERLHAEYDEIYVKYRKVKKYYFDKCTEVSVLLKNQEAMDQLVQAKNAEISTLTEPKKGSSKRHANESEVADLIKLKDATAKLLEAKDAEISRLKQKYKETVEQINKTWDKYHENSDNVLMLSQQNRWLSDEIDQLKKDPDSEVKEKTDKILKQNNTILKQDSTILEQDDKIQEQDREIQKLRAEIYLRGLTIQQLKKQQFLVDLESRQAGINEWEKLLGNYGQAVEPVQANDEIALVGEELTV